MLYLLGNADGVFVHPDTGVVEPIHKVGSTDFIVISGGNIRDSIRDNIGSIGVMQPDEWRSNTFDGAIKVHTTDELQVRLFAFTDVDTFNNDTIEAIKNANYDQICNSQRNKDGVNNAIRNQTWI